MMYGVLSPYLGVQDIQITSKHQTIQTDRLHRNKPNNRTRRKTYASERFQIYRQPVLESCSTSDW